MLMNRSQLRDNPGVGFMGVDPSDIAHAVKSLG